MSPVEKEKIRAWIRRWSENGLMLQRMRLEEHLRSDLGETLLALTDANDAAIIAHPPKPYSGVIEMQRIFAKLRENEAGT